MSDIVASGADWRDSLSSLTNLGGLAFVFNDLGPKPQAFPQMLEISAEQALRSAAAEGNAVAMERLGTRLLYGQGLTAAPREGLHWLERSAETGNAVAMELLAEFRLDEGREHARDAEALLVKAFESGYLPAQVTLGMHLLEGTGLARDSARGERLLREAAWRGNRLAHLVLGACLLGGRGVSADREAGSGWLRRLGGVAAIQVSALGAYLLGKSLTQFGGRRRRLTEYAAVLFAEAVRLGHEADEMNLAYLLRRGEIEGGGYPTLDALLDKHLAGGNAHALLNQALRLARGAGCAVDWRTADGLIARITDPVPLMSWWSERSVEGDAEGHLVVAWLARHRLASDPLGRPIAERLGTARAGGWDIPAWMDAEAARA